MKTSSTRLVARRMRCWGSSPGSISPTIWVTTRRIFIFYSQCIWQNWSNIGGTHNSGFLLSRATQWAVHRVGPSWGINKVQPSTKPIQSIRPSSFLPAPSLIHSRFVLFYFIWAVFKLMATCNYGLLYRLVAQCIWTSCRSCLLAMDCFCLTLWMPLS